MRSDGWKLIWGSDGRHELYHVAADPDETNDLASEMPDRLADLEEILWQQLVRLSGRPRAELESETYQPRDAPAFQDVDEETLEQLRTLGYVN